MNPTLLDKIMSTAFEMCFLACLTYLVATNKVSSSIIENMASAAMGVFLANRAKPKDDGAKPGVGTGTPPPGVVLPAIAGLIAIGSKPFMRTSLAAAACVLMMGCATLATAGRALASAAMVTELVGVRVATTTCSAAAIYLFDKGYKDEAVALAEECKSDLEPALKALMMGADATDNWDPEKSPVKVACASAATVDGLSKVKLALSKYGIPTDHIVDDAVELAKSGAERAGPVCAELLR